MKKKIILVALLLFLLMSFMCIPVLADSYSGICGANLTYEFNSSNNTLTIYGTGPMNEYDTERPWEDFKWNIVNVVISEGVTSIGDSAFWACYNLTSITIPDSVTSIGDSAFASCDSLTSITIPESVTSIGRGAFEHCRALTSITIPDSVTSIGHCAFGRCSALTSITIPDSVTSIGDSAFERCSALTSITIPDSVTSIELCTFNYCSNLTSITIPDSVTSIGPYAFSYCSSLTSITIPDGVTSISMEAFSYCSNLTSITIPENVTSISWDAFRYCSNLTSIICLFDNARIYGGVETLYPDATIYGYANSTIHEYATKYNENFVCLPCKDGCAIAEIIAPEYLKSEATCTEKAVYYKSCTVCSIASTAETFEEGAYKHIFTQESTSAQYLKSEATCTEKAAYYKSCSVCGIASATETFEVGGYKHDFTQKSTLDRYLKSEATCTQKAVYYKSCSICGIASETEKFEAGGYKEHQFTQESTSAQYLKSEATCTAKAVYYKSCIVCGIASPTETFKVGGYKHDFTQKSTLDKYLKSEATCTAKTVYYNSCTLCGEASKDLTFESGNMLAHIYDQEKMTNEYLSSAGTCFEVAVYYKSCICGKVSKDTFTYGEVLGHTADTTPGVAEVVCTKCNQKISKDMIMLQYNSIGATESFLSQFAPKGTEITICDTIPTKEECTFMGWATEANGEVKYQSGEKIVLTESLQLYAVWNKTCSVCSGSGKKPSAVDCPDCTDGYESVTYCTKCKGTGSVSAGYYTTCEFCYGSGKEEGGFGGICLMCRGTGKVLVYDECSWCDDGYASKVKCATCSGHKVVTQYVDCDNCNGVGGFKIYMVEYNANGGTGAPDMHEIEGLNDTLSTKIPQKEGYVFVGWNTVDNPDTVYQPGDVYVGGAVTFYAMWLPECNICEGKGYSSATCSNCEGEGSYRRFSHYECNYCGYTGFTVYGWGPVCNNCLRSSYKSIYETVDCSSCIGGIKKTTCENCDGLGYLVYTTGDVDGNESINKDDAIYLLMHTFFPEDYPINQPGDFDGNGNVNKDDAIYLLMHTFFPEDYPLTMPATTLTLAKAKNKEEDE